MPVLPANEIHSPKSDGRMESGRRFEMAEGEEYYGLRMVVFLRVHYVQ